MNARQLVALIEQMDKVDKGRTLPRLPGPYGTFLMRYARERRDVIDLALEHRLQVRHDGAISGKPLGSIVLVPLAPPVAETVEETPWGRLGLCLALSPELLAPQSLRLWLSAAAAREAFRKLVTSDGKSLRIHGDFRWLPPGVITPGTSEFTVEDRGSDHSWMLAPHLKTTADDMVDIPHALDYRYVSLGGHGLLANFRTFVTVKLPDGSIIVPGGLRPRSARLDARNVQLITGRLAICLAYREPGETRWTIWSSIEIDGAQALDHNLNWASFMRGLAGMQGLDGPVTSACRSALLAVDIDLPSRVSRLLDFPVLQDAPLDGFLKALTALMRLGPRRSPSS